TEGSGLVWAESRRRRRDPNEDVEQDHELEDEPEGTHPARSVPAESVPAAEEEGDAEPRERDQVDVLGHREEPEAHAAVLGVVPGDELLLRLGEVEWGARGLRDSGEEEDDEAHELGGRVPDGVVLRRD